MLTLLLIMLAAGHGGHATTPPGAYAVPEDCSFIPPRVVFNQYLRQFDQAEAVRIPVAAEAVLGKIREIIPFHAVDTEVCVETFPESLAEWCGDKGVNEKTLHGWRRPRRGGFLYEGACHGGPTYLLACPGEAAAETDAEACVRELGPRRCLP
jgi:hypothetical protein